MSTLTFLHVHLGKINAVEVHVHLGKFNAVGTHVHLRKLNSVETQYSQKSLVLYCQLNKNFALVPFPWRYKIFHFVSACNGLVVSGHLH